MGRKVAALCVIACALACAAAYGATRGERSVAVGKWHRVTPVWQFEPLYLNTFAIAPRGRAGFLVVWAGSGRRRELLARRVKATGAPVGAPVQVAADKYVLGTRLAHDTRRGGYLLLYEERNSEIVAQRLDPRGKPVGDPHAVTDARRNGLIPTASALVYDRASDGYLLVWRTFPEDFDDRTGEDVYTRRISAAGRPTGRPHLVMSGDAACDIATGHARAAMLACAVERVVYTRPVALRSGRPQGEPALVLRGATGVRLTAGRRGYALAARGDRRVLVRPLSATGRRAGSGTSYGVLPGYEDHGPYSLAYSARYDRVLLTWTADREDHSHRFEYGGQGQLLDGRGARRIGKRFTIAVRGPGSFAGRHLLEPGRPGDFALLTERSVGEGASTLIAQRVIPRR